VPQGPPIYAHRLGAEYGPESSRAALERSLELGVDGLEADVVLSSDGEVLALHDPILSLSTDAEGWANEVSAAEIRAARLLDSQGEPSDQQPMALGDLLEEIPAELPLQLDVKTYADHALAGRTADRACEVALEHGTAARVEVVSFFTAACLAAVERGIAARLAAWADYAPEALAQWASSRGIAGVSLEGFILAERIVEALHGAGLSVSIGSVNTGGQLRRLLPLRPDILVSDCPGELAGELEAALGDSAASPE
jgi:glycerophosphoryl diester phosphodiesterase